MAGMLMGLQPSGGTGGGAAFDPTQQPNLYAWWFAGDLSTLFQDVALTTPVTANNQVVKAWVDKVSARQILQPTTGNAPLYKSSLIGGQSYVKLDGSNDFMSYSVAIGSGYEIFVKAYQPRNTFPGPSPQVDYMICSGLSGIQCYEYSMYNSFGTTANDAFYNVKLTNPWLDGASISPGASMSGNATHVLSGVADGTSTSNLGYYLGTSSDNTYFCGLGYREIVVYSTARTDPQRTQLHTYLSTH